VLSKYRDFVFKVISKYVKKLSSLGIKPWHFTFLGLLLSLLYLYALATNSVLFAIIFLLTSGFMDVLDGALAKTANILSKCGAYLDSMFDRLEDSAYYIGLIILNFDCYIVFLALALTLTLTYSKARLENLGIDEPRVSLFERSDRIVVLAFILATYIVNSRLSNVLFSIYVFALTVIVVLRIITGYTDLSKT